VQFSTPPFKILDDENRSSRVNFDRYHSNYRFRKLPASTKPDIVYEIFSLQIKLIILVSLLFVSAETTNVFQHFPHISVTTHICTLMGLRPFHANELNEQYTWVLPSLPKV
jgi:hypothetical protein